MNIKNGLFKSVAINWETITLPLKAGTPISASGIIANSKAAIGLIPETIKEKPLMKNIYVLIAGAVEEAEVNASSGLTISKDAKEAMSGITFFGADGTPSLDPVYDIPDATTQVKGLVKIGAGLSVSSGTVSLTAATDTAIGGVKMAANVAVAAGDAPTKEEFDALISALITAGIMTAPASEG